MRTSGFRKAINAHAAAAIGWAMRSHALAPVGRQLLKVIVKALPYQHMYVASFRKERRWISDLIQTVRRERELMIRNDEAFTIVLATKQTAKLEGDIAEVGVYQGGSAKLICEVKGDRHLYLFDTFEGLPAPGPHDDSCFSRGDYSCSLDEVRNYLKDYKNVHFVKGLFPCTATAVEGRTFAFVNLDVDLYESTLSALDFFYPRMSANGVILSHDYQGASGVHQAVDEFFNNRPEPVIELISTQCIIVKSCAR